MSGPMITFPPRIAILGLRTSSTAVLYHSALPLLHLLQLSVDNRSLKLAQQSHAHVFCLGLDQQAQVVTRLISAYSLCEDPVCARLVFDTVRVKTISIWNSLITGYLKNTLYAESFALFRHLCSGETSPDEFTFASLTKVSGDDRNLVVGKSIHGMCIRSGFLSDTVVCNSLLSMYSKCVRPLESRKLFDEMTDRNVSSWNTIISCHVSSSDRDIFDYTVWDLIKQMQIEGLKLDAFTVSIILPLCGGNAKQLGYGRELHSYIVKNDLGEGFNSDLHLGCCLIDMYSRSSKISVGRQIFDRLNRRNVFAWTAMINGYVINGEFPEALVLFREMHDRDGIAPNKVSLVSILPACGSYAGLTGGKQIHGFSIRRELTREVSLSNALIDMYSKCGSLTSARQVFDYRFVNKDAISWSSMIFGYGLHGKAREAATLFVEMLQLGIKPDAITIVGVLSACGRAGLVDEGLSIYTSMVKDHGVKPTLEICACMVDMLGRAGRLNEAIDFVRKMPVEPGPSVWGALVSASVLHGNEEMQHLVYSFLTQLEPENPSNYVSLSNLYASSRRWDSVAEVRKLMKERGLRKLPGCSWVCINGKTQCFYVADKAHPCCDLIYEMLDQLIQAMKGIPFSHDFDTCTGF